jgi:hypothetical protein
VAPVPAPPPTLPKREDDTPQRAHEALKPVVEPPRRTGQIPKQPPVDDLKTVETPPRRTAQLPRQPDADEEVPTQESPRRTWKIPKQPPEETQASPTHWRRLVVIGVAALVAAGAALTVVFWPRHEEPPPVLAQAAVTPTTPPPEPPAPETHKPRTATVVVTTDAPAMISIDGTARTGDLTQSATLEIMPGVPHTVSAQRPGHATQALKLEPLAPGEQLPVSLKLK